MTTYLAIDPSITSCGVYDGYEGIVIKTTTDKCDLDRFKIITDKIEEYFCLPNEEVVVGIEGFSMGSRGRGVSKMYGIGWAIRIMLHRRGITFYEIPPTALKKFVTGKGNCEKSLILKEVFRKWKFDTSDNNISDAFGIWKLVQHLHEGTIPELEYEKEVIEALKKPKV